MQLRRLDDPEALDLPDHRQAAPAVAVVQDDLAAHVALDRGVDAVNRLQLLPHAADDLCSFTLLHVLHRPDDWENWFNTAGVHNAEAHRGLRFEHSGMVYQAAEGLVTFAVLRGSGDQHSGLPWPNLAIPATAFHRM